MVSNMDAPNYPDILGYATQGKKARLGAIETALAVYPRAVHAGSSFCGILLLQNMTDVKVEVVVNLSVAEPEISRKKQHFIVPNSGSRIMLRPGEVGFAALPMLCQEDTTAGKQYKFMATLKITSFGEPRFIRQVHQTDVNLDYYFFFSPKTIDKLSSLRKLTFSEEQHKLSSSSCRLEVPLVVLPAQSKEEDQITTTSWVDLWSLIENTDNRPLLERYGPTLNSQILPLLRSESVSKALRDITIERFSPVYKIQAAEVHFITKLMMKVLEMASEPTQSEYPGLTIYHVADVLHSLDSTQAGHPLDIPNWLYGFLMLSGMDEHEVHLSVSALMNHLFDDLLRDAVEAGFHIINYELGETVFEENEIFERSDHILNSLHQKTQLSFMGVYLPLVLGGIASWDLLGKKGGEQLENMHVIDQCLNTWKHHHALRTAAEERFLEVADEILRIALQRYTEWM